MDWMKILNKGWKDVVQTIIIIIAIVVILIGLNGFGMDGDNSIREDIRSIRNELVTLEEQGKSAIELINGVIETGDRVDAGLTRLQQYNQQSQDFTEELATGNTRHQERVRLIQDRSLESEFITDEIKQLIQSIERENDWSSEQE